MVFSPLSVIGAKAVTYPDGLSEQQILSVIPKLNSLTKALLSTGNTDVSAEVYSMLYSDETLNGLFSEIYTALSENAEALTTIGVDISPTALSQHLQSYPSIASKTASCKDINAVIKASKDFKWEVSTKKGFGNALASMLAPFNELLNALLCSGSVNINSLIAIKGADGYTNVIVPLLKALDCPDIMDSANFAALAKQNYRNIVRNLVSMLFVTIDEVLANPVIAVCKTLPKLAYYIKSGKLSESINLLLEPLSLKIAGIFTIPGISDLITGAANLEDGFDIDAMLGDLDLSSLIGTDTDIVFPDMDLSALSECVTENGSEMTVNEAAALTVVLNYLCDALQLNKTALTSSDSADMFGSILSKSNDELIKAVITLFSVTTVSENTNTLTYPAMQTAAFSYTPVFTADDYAAFLENADPLLTDFVKESDPDGNIEDTLKKTIYSNSLVSTLVKEVFSLFDDETLSGLMSVFGFNTTPAGVADTIASVSSSTANYLYARSNWKSVNTAYLYWGFSDGDRDGFVRALTRVLSPLTPVMTALLAGESCTIANALTIPGADGYNTAVIPLFEALGCKADSYKTYTEYKLGAGTSSVISDVLNPICDLLDEVCAAPIKTVCRILPNIVYFMDSSLFEQVIENLIYPINELLKAAGFSDILSSAFDMSQDLDINSMLTSLVADSSLNVTLPEANFSLLGTLGTLTTFQSKRTLGGAAATYSYVVAQSPAVFLTIMRYVTKLITAEENADLLTGLMGSTDSSSEGGASTEGAPDMFAMFASNIGDKFKNMTSDETVEWLCDLLFSSSPIKELPDENKELPTIIYEKKFELSTTQKLIIVLVVAALLALLYYILSVSGKLDKIKLRLRKKAELKRREKERRELDKASGIKPDKANKKSERKDKNDKAITTERQSFPETQKTVPEIKSAENIIFTEKTEKEKTSEETAKTVPVNKNVSDSKQRIEYVTVLSEDDFEKQDRRRKAAMKKMYKNQIKSQKIYEKALKQAEKKK